MIYFAVFFGVFGLGCLYNGATGNAIGFGVLALFSLFMALLNSYNYRREKAFSQWLFANADRLWNKSPVDNFKGEEYEKFDTLTQFSYCVSFLFFSRTYYSHSYHTKKQGADAPDGVLLHSRQPYLRLVGNSAWTNQHNKKYHFLLPWQT